MSAIINFFIFQLFLLRASGLDVLGTLSDTTSYFYGAITNTTAQAYQVARCPLGDCCNDYWIPNDLQKLRRHLSSDLFGQHIATDVILKQLNAHLSNKSPLKPLVMSFHGWTGNGKNHVAYLIAKSLFLKGAESKHYHHFMATTHFPHASHTTQYQDQIRSWISGNVSNCKNSLFVFDEVDKMPCGVLDGIRSFLDYNEHVDRVDFRRSIFILLSNTGGKQIVQKAHEVWLEGRRREELTIRDFERLIELGAFNEEGGGLHKAAIIEKSLIDMYVPFLPMEKSHIRLCAEQEFKRQAFIPSDMNTALRDIADSLIYYPPGKELYSSTGCKRVSQKVGIYIANERYKFNDEL